MTVMDNAQISVLLIDDHQVVREGLKAALISEGFAIAGEAATKAEGFAQITHKNPHVIVVDLNLPDGDGLEIVSWGRSVSSAIGIVIVTLMDDDAHLLAALQAGASAYVNKSAPLTEVTSAVGHSYAAPLSFIARGLRGAISRRADGFGLTPRELEVLHQLPRGLTSSQIGKELFITEATVKTHLASMYRKLGVANRMEAVVTAMQHRLIS